MTPDKTYTQWDWTQPATVRVALKAHQLDVNTPALAKHRRNNTGPAFQQLSPELVLYWMDGRTRAEQLAYFASLESAA
ncbi:hypothetical protein [Ruegeria atlantica]|uniref:Uncharacterized protein n=1 Tax=Ruegeria atlantica TaxID=81569 RepID=A0A0P1EFP5_9RHOB|nr:hypothetical protein [Ruegeria atlantica]CUH48950.1 hypothetical protein RUA4292_03141 [Ruegeria atlantica]